VILTRLNKKKVCIVTGTRAEYGLLRLLMERIQESEYLDLQIIVTGAHLSYEFGLTYRTIEEDGFYIDKKVEMLLSSDTEVGITKSMGLGMIGFADALNEANPDLLIVLGDRFEAFVAASAATVARIPIAHLYGGETTEGAYDEAFRHSITKMSHLHFTSTDIYRNRVIQMGEDPDRVFNVGTTSIDNIKSMRLLSREEFEESINLKLNKKNLLITYHPETLGRSSSVEEFQKILSVLDVLEDVSLIFTEANADNGGRAINEAISGYVQNNNQKAVVFKTLGELRYLSAMQYVDAVVGNSSSGLTEAPSFKVGTINVGDRQLGRVRSTSVIDCLDSKHLDAAFRTLYSSEFKSNLAHVINPYGLGGSVDKIVSVLEYSNLDNILQKCFRDMPISK
jgi:GDP/UDP-N,N'-diacetylbacillosamine 2-epimerase (hydrolysing)